MTITTIENEDQKPGRVLEGKPRNVATFLEILKELLFDSVNVFKYLFYLRFFLLRIFFYRQMVPRTGLEPAYLLRCYHLKVVRLPISPPGHSFLEFIYGDPELGLE